MKKLARKALIGLLAFTFCFGAAFFDLAAFNLDLGTTSIAEAKTTYRYGRTQLTNKSQRYMYDKVLKAVKEKKKTATFDYKNYTTSQKNFDYAVLALYYDYPEYDYARVLSSSYSYYIIKGKVRIAKMHISYSSELKSQSAEFNAKVKEIIASIPEDCTTKYDKALYLHDYICEHTEYVNEGDSNVRQQSAYGPILYGQAVCEGYARAYRLLLQKAGIKAWYVSGYADGDKDGVIDRATEPHGWNMIWLDGECYYIDVTWDDTIDTTQPSRLYFVKSKETFELDHDFTFSTKKSQKYRKEFQDKAIPECGHDDTKFLPAGTVILEGTLGIDTLSRIKEGMGEVVSYYDEQDGRTKYMKRVDIYYDGDEDLVYYLNNLGYSNLSTLGIGGTIWYSVSKSGSNYTFKVAGTSTI